MGSDDNPIPRVIGVAWFRRENYAALRALFEDGHKMATTWDGWLKEAEQIEDRARGHGIPLERVDIDPDEIAAWGASEGKAINREGRQEFVALKIAKKYGRTH